MRGWWVAGLVVAAVLASPSPAGATELLDAIDEGYRAGRLTRDQRILYRVAAVRAPAELPAPYAAWPGRSEPLDRGQTSVLVEAFQALPTLAPAVAARVRDLLAPPPPLAYSVERADVFPFRVSYGDPSLAVAAEQVLEAAETSYQKQVEQWGFWAPSLEPGTSWYELFLMDPGSPGVAGYTAPYLENDATPNADTFSYIVIGDSFSGLFLDSVVAHEFNHACQLSMDASEQLGFLENTASYIESAVFPQSFPYTAAMFPDFQRRPFRPLEFAQPGTSDGYEYGGALWVLFLEHRYGADDPSWLRRIWEGSVQDGWDNEPDYFDVLDTELDATGGLAQAVRAFAEDRFFVGDDDDGLHLPDAWQWGGAEVWRTATWSTAQLPLVDQAPALLESRPRPNGCNYVVLDPDGAATLPVRFSFGGAAALRWHVALLQRDRDGGSAAASIVLDDQAQGSASVALAGVAQVALVVCQLGEEGYDPDDHAWEGGAYRYSIEWDLPAPTVTEITPGAVAQGAHDVIATVNGDGFVDHEELTVAVSGAKVAASLEEVVSPRELRVRLTVAPSAELGARDVIVTNPGGAAGVGSGLLTIVEPATAAVGDGELAPAGGCACSAPARSTGRQSVWLWLLALAGLRRHGAAPPCRGLRADGPGGSGRRRDGDGA